jgi:ATP-dependent RNA helicase DeaD
MLRSHPPLNRHPDEPPASRGIFPHFVQKTLKSGKNSVIETGGLQPGFPVYAPLLLQRFGRSAQPGVLGLLIFPDAASLKNLVAGMTGPHQPRQGLFLAIGEHDNIRREVPLVLAGPAVLAGTSQRIIDHLRRGNLSLGRTAVIAAECSSPALMPGLAADLAFILSKTSPACQTLLFVDRYVPDRPMELLKFERIHLLTTWLKPAPLTQYIAIPAGVPRNSLLADFCLAETRRPLSIMSEDRASAQLVLRDLRARGLDARLAGEGSGGLAIDYPGSGGSARLAKSVLMVYTEVPKETQFLEHFFQAGEFVVLLAEQEAAALARLEENAPVKFDKKPLPAEDAILKGTIKSLIEKIKTEEDPNELNHYKKLVKSSVPIFLRSYFAGYLVKLFLGGSQPGSVKKTVIRESGRSMTNLFLSVGKNRKVFPRDLSSLLASVPGIQKADLGDIRVLDNYSFAEVAEPVAQSVIDKLNGAEFRGRKLTVNFARKKDETQESPQ